MGVSEERHPARSWCGEDWPGSCVGTTPGRVRARGRQRGDKPGWSRVGQCSGRGLRHRGRRGSPRGGRGGRSGGCQCSPPLKSGVHSTETQVSPDGGGGQSRNLPPTPALTAEDRADAEQRPRLITSLPCPSCEDRREQKEGEGEGMAGARETESSLEQPGVRQGPQTSGGVPTFPGGQSG